MMRKTMIYGLSVLLLAAGPAVTLTGPAFTTSACKSAAVDHDKAMAWAADVYRKAVLAADKAYALRLAQLASSSQVKGAVGESERVQAAEAAVAHEEQDCTDASLAVAIVPFTQAGAKLSASLHKGMTKAELLKLYPVPTEQDRVLDGGDTEVMEWAGWDARDGHAAIKPCRVTLEHGIVTDFEINVKG